MYFCDRTKRLMLDQQAFDNYIEIDGFSFELRDFEASGIGKSQSPNASLFCLWDPDEEDVTQVIKFCRYYKPCSLPHLKLRCDRFEREIAALKKIRELGKSDHVVEILADGEEERSGKTFRYYTMEIAKENLADFLRRENLEPQQRFLLCADIIKCINSLHDLGIYHRDIKPGNFLITDDDNWKIADLGLIDSREEDLAAVDDGGERERIGPRGFLSPEALNRWLGLNDPPPKIDDKSDVFQLARVMGVILQGDILCGQLTSCDFEPAEDSESLFEVMAGAFQYNASHRFDISELRDEFLGKFAKKYVLA